jgi:high-affinity K+ transport system ATPase subunit B
MPLKCRPGGATRSVLERAMRVRALHGLGLDRVVLLTGDTRETAEAIGRAAGIDEIHAGLLPADKEARRSRRRRLTKWWLDAYVPQS